MFTAYHRIGENRYRERHGLDFEDLSSIDLVGIFPDYASAEAAWRSHAQRTVDDAEMKYVIVHLHRSPRWGAS